MTKKKDLSPLLLLLFRASQVLPCVLYLSHHHHHIIKVRDTTTTYIHVPPAHEKVCLGKSLRMSLSDNSNSENCLRGSWNITLLFKPISIALSFFYSILSSSSSSHPLTLYIPTSPSPYLTSYRQDKTASSINQSINHEPQSQSHPQLPLQQPKRRRRKRKRRKKKTSLQAQANKPSSTHHLHRSRREETNFLGHEDCR